MLPASSKDAPLSGSLFALSPEPFLRVLETRYVNLQFGRAFACADDIAVTGCDVENLPILVKFFRDIEEATGLVPKAKKCRFIVLHAKVTPFSY
eukprot:3281047-Karenia_brevis.AAC.1